MWIKIVNKTEFDLPKYETQGSAGMDLRANLKPEKIENTEEIDPYDEENWDEADTLTLEPGKQQLVPTGLFIQLPNPVLTKGISLIGNQTYYEGWGYEAQIRPRSGLAVKHGITIVNSPGTIDSDYRGEIKIILMNLTDKPFTINHGDRIAQMVIAKYERIYWEQVDELDETKRGAGGFGHSGTK